MKKRGNKREQEKRERQKGETERRTEGAETDKARMGMDLYITGPCMLVNKGEN